MNIQMIALNQLVASPANVRKTGRSIGIDELAASIAAHGLLQNLQVRRGAKDKYEVVAGGRRLTALKLLVKQKVLAKDAEIPCHILDSEDAGEISLAENTVRLAMHPADQFVAFYALAESGKGVEDIAARFGVSVAVVKQRLKLASVSPTLIAVYRDDQMSLDQLMAFAVSDDPAAQEAAWFDRPEWQRQPDAIRRMLTAAHIEASDRRVQFVGLDIYKDAGGGIVRDLFEPEHEGYLTDPALLDRLVDDRLVKEATIVRSKGWQWVQIVPLIEYDTLRGYQRIFPETTPLPPQQQEELDRLAAAYDALNELCDDDADSDIVEQLNVLSAQIDALQEQSFAWRAEDIALAGAVVGIGYNGEIKIERGFIHPDDRKRHQAIGGNLTATANDDNSPASPLSARLIEDLTAERTAALRAVVADNQHAALAALAHALALPVFYPAAYGITSCLDVTLKCRDLQSSADGIEESGAVILLDTRHIVWQERLPNEPDALLGWLIAQDTAAILDLMTYCAAMSIDAVRGKQDRADAPRLVHADALATAVGLDMAVWWEPTNRRYLARVPKALILDAVREGVSPSAADNLGTIKKKVDLVRRAGERLAGKGWLPPILRSPESISQKEEMTPEAAE